MECDPLLHPLGAEPGPRARLDEQVRYASVFGVAYYVAHSPFLSYLVVAGP